MVPPASHKVSRVSWYSGYQPAYRFFAYGTFTLYGLGFPAAHSAKLQGPFAGPLPQTTKGSLVWAFPRSLATTYGITIVFFSCRYLDVSVPCVSLRTTMYSWYGTCEFTTGGFPHSEIHESMAICASSWLIAAYRVLHRLLVPRHSPYALSSLTNSKIAIANDFARIWFS